VRRLQCPGPEGVRYLHDLGLALGCYQPVKDRLDLGHAQVVATTSVSETDRALQVTAGCNLDNADACMLLVLWAQAAIEGTAPLYSRRKFVGDGPRPFVQSSQIRRGWPPVYCI